MIQKLTDGIDPLSTGRASCDHNTITALRHARRIADEIRKIVSLNFFLDCGKQNGFLHSRGPDGVQRTGRNAVYTLDLDDLSRELSLRAVSHRAVSHRAVSHRAVSHR